ncbi:LPXTG cell wall anchor domain-containing protein [Actinoplanes sp. NPDC051343]|jgi:LPXTG-motif cell wall-anchored protein|uniref:LPXTG cell wall anchor domain-containing protein n=1 Tax=Actinoplanes sp. NPDC051343 TaxID=3363906 RepID=UPI00378E1906
MSLTRRMIAAGLPAAGVTVLAALALSGAPASAAPADVAGLRPVAMATPCTGGYRANCAQGYGNETPGGTLPTTTAPAPTHNRTSAATTPGTTHTRGHGGYGGVSPATTPPTTTPTGHANTVPPGGVSPSSATPVPTVSKPGGGVSAGSALPVTGPTTGALASLGGILLAAGAASIWYTRRRRNA